MSWSPCFRFDSISSARIAPLLRALELVDLEYLTARPDTPALYRSGVRYRRDPPGVEDWLDIPGVLRRGAADCKSLAAWRAAELVRAGYQAKSVWTADCKPRGCLYHVVVWRGDGTIEDPSVRLGMRAEARWR